MSKIESFEVNIQPLQRDRVVWVYLPDDYDPKGKPFPVIYMQDGQNLFYEKLTAYGMCWQADKTMDRLYKALKRSAIVVGVESSVYRMSEYSPWRTSQLLFANKQIGKYKGGEGSLYADFFAKQLKPIIDSKYNTDKEREATAVCGSSMGAFISVYIALKYQRIYGTVGAFSTSCNFNAGAFYRFVRKVPVTHHQYMLVYVGGSEGEKRQAKMNFSSSKKLYLSLKKKGVSCEFLANGDFSHNEKAWAVYFEKFAADFLNRYYDQLNV